MELITLHIQLGRRQYKIKLAPENETHVREALAKIQASDQQLRAQFPDRDEQDYLAMTLIDIITHVQTTPKKSDHELALEAKIAELAKTLNP